MKKGNIEIRYLDFLYRMNGNLCRDIKEILMARYRSGYAAELPQIDDLELIEIYEIMRMPVIQLVGENPVKPEQPHIRLIIFSCSCLRGCSFLNLFTGGNWKFYIVNL